MNLMEEYQSLGETTLKEILKKLKQEEKDVKNEKRRKFFSSLYLNKNNVKFFELLNSNYYKKLQEMEKKALKFRENKGNIDKFQLNNKKEKLRKEKEYIELAYPTVTDDLWEVELEQSLVLKALKSL